MTRLPSATNTLEWWEAKIIDVRAALAEDPLNPKLQQDLESTERYRERAYSIASEIYEQEQADEYAAQWASWAYGPDVNG